MHGFKINQKYYTRDRSHVSTLIYIINIINIIKYNYKYKYKYNDIISTIDPYAIT